MNELKNEKILKKADNFSVSDEDVESFKQQHCLESDGEAINFLVKKIANSIGGGA